VGTFTPDPKSAELNAIVVNHRSTPSAPFKLTFEFLSAKGDVVAMQDVDVAALAPTENRALDAKGQGSGIVAWRYRRAP